MSTGDPLYVRVRDALRPKYELEAELGRGGMGIVYRASDTVLRRQVAIKVLRPDASSHEEVRFYREAQFLAKIQSRHVVGVLSCDPSNGEFCYFVMELIPGGNLDELIKSSGPLNPHDVVKLGVDLLTGLEAIHQQQLIHRDLKPSNVFPRAGRGVIGDFGIARDESPAATTTTSVGAGTRDYMAPEQLAGGTIGPPTDVHGIGVVLFEACAGKSWKLGTSHQSAAWTAIPAWLRPVLQRALEFDQRDRWQDAASFRAALQQAPGIPVRRRWLGGGIGALAATILMVWASICTRSRSNQPKPEWDLAILPFGNVTDSSRGLSRYLQEPLDRFHRIRARSVPSNPAYPALLTLSDYRQLRTRYYVDGRVLGDTTIELTVNDSQMVRRILVPRQSLDYFSWGRSAADSIVAQFFAAQYQDFHAAAGCGGSGDLRAVELYLQGQKAFLVDAYAVADRLFTQALQKDGKFTLAGWQRALSRRWLRTLQWDELRELHDRADSCGATWFNRLLSAQLELDLRRRLDSLARISRDAPTLAIARLLYADEMFHRGPLIGLPDDSIIVALDSAMIVDTSQDQAPALDHLIWIWTRTGQEPQAREAVEWRERVARANRNPEFNEGVLRTRFLRLAYDVRFHPLKGHAKLSWLLWHPPERIVAAVSEYVHLASAFDIPDAQRRMGQALVESGGSAARRAEGFLAQGLAAITLGRPSESFEHFDSAAAILQTPASKLASGEWRILPRSLGLPEPSEETQRHGRDLVNRFSNDSNLAPRAIWALATAAYAKGDLSAARGLATRLSSDSTQLKTRSRLTRLLAAFDSAAAGHPQAALQVSEPLLAWDPEWRTGDPFDRALLYMSRGKWLEQLKRLDDAERSYLWYESSDLDGWGVGELQAGHVDAALSALGRLLRARVAKERGSPQIGCGYLRRVKELWSHAEPGYRAAWDEAWTQLDRCQ